ncbi:hypothetical protein [uncultured Paracoccus sp.]|uniref:hypothetical protein n=1 Tax=uncultured Paracoccus sp. TaxID=189685 RepID=UPI00261AFC60|nr:hypothetical protein [uncultured Paracoccus sp.]
MISSAKGWPPLGDDQRRADLARIEALHGISFRPLDRPGQLPADAASPASS